MTEATHIVVLITAPSREIARQIADALLDKKLVACVNLIAPVESRYVWKGERCTDEEVLLLAKTRAALFATQLVPTVKALHPYEVPEIIALPILMGAADYLAWIDESTG
ncbi:MAG: divalent-cation tolerance protein CutA [Anaerolineae bacterium]|nr:divalent-cation tolerance protein CutA [Anaerolineae bacterium]MDW8070315.1 divalent-cation tolerance protein CutA [Anaerolineae bacterium]